MTWVSDHLLHLVFITGYLGLLIHHGWAGKKQTHTISDYLVAGRGLGGWVIALSFYATFMSTNTFIGAAGKSWNVGLIWCAGTVILSGLCFASWFLVAPRFVPLTREYNSLTIPDFLGTRYGSGTVRRVAAVLVVFSSVVYLVAIYKGSVIALQLMLNMPFVTAGIIIFFVVTAYTLAGGFRSVVLTDAVQGTLMVAGAVALVVSVIFRGGGIGAILDSLRVQDPALVSWRGNMPLMTVIGLSLAVGIKYVVEPRQLSRFYGLKDRRALRLAAVVAPLLVLLTYICLMPIGAMARALIPMEAIESSDQVVPYLLGTAELFGPVLSTLFLLVLISAAMSSIDSVLLVAASSMDRDLLVREGDGDGDGEGERAVGGGDAAAIRRTRIWVVVFSLAALAGALSPYSSDIVTITSFSGALYGACFFPALVVGLFWKGGSSTAALASMILGAVATIGWFVARRNGWVATHEVFVGMAVGLVVYGLIRTRTAESDASPRR